MGIPSDCDTDWLDERIAAIKASIKVHEAAIDAIASGEAMFSLDTGQTRTTVTKANVASVAINLERLENRLSYYEHKRYGGGTTRVVPSF